MANDLAGNVWIIDTPSATPIYLSNVKIITIIWENPLLVDDILELQTAAGKVFLSARCEVNGQTQIFRLGKWYPGVKVATISSGKAYIHFV